MESAAVYGSKSNRLMYSPTYNILPEPDELLSTAWYYYNGAGNVTRLVTKEESVSRGSASTYTAVRFGYASNQNAVSFVLGETWTWDGISSCPANYNVAFAREFRYDSGRARYLNRELDPAGLMQNPPVYTPLSETWTGYDGDAPYRDFTISGGQLANGDAYVPGAWRAAGSVPEYLHNDHLGTLRRTTSSSGLPGPSRVFTAFGERVTGPIDRYGYVGAFGYQQHTEFPFLHVGARWYDPGSGRFLQRDPLGILAAVNVYEYVGGSPTVATDPSGLISSIHGAVITGALSAREVAELLGLTLVVLAVGNEFSEDAGALIDLAKEAIRRGGLTCAEAEAMKKWGEEYGARVRGPETHPNRPFGKYPHIHVGPVDHVPVGDFGFFFFWGEP